MERFKNIKYDFVELLDHYEHLKSKIKSGSSLNCGDRIVAGARVLLTCETANRIHNGCPVETKTYIFSGIVIEKPRDMVILMGTSCGKSVKFLYPTYCDDTVQVFPNDGKEQLVRKSSVWVMCPDQEMAKISIEAQKQVLACTDFTQYLARTPTENATLDLNWFSKKYLVNCTTYTNRAHAIASIMNQFGGAHFNECFIKVTFIGVPYCLQDLPNVGPYGTPIQYETQNP